MIEETLKKIGLTASQAKTYLLLIENGRLTPPQLAKLRKDNRTAAYMSLAKLEELELAKIVSGKNPKVYEPVSPSALSKVIDRKRQELDQTEIIYKNSLSTLLSEYFAKQKKPSVRFYSGVEGLQEIYKDHLKIGGDTLVIRTIADEQFGQILYDYMEKRAEKGISTQILGPAFKDRVEWATKNNKRLKRVNYWVPTEYYTAPVEISIYSNRVSFISFGEEAVGIIIESQQIAESMTQLFKLAKIGGDSLMSRRS